MSLRLLRICGTLAVNNLRRNKLNIQPDRSIVTSQINKYSKAYDYDGKTRAQIMNTDLEYGLMITGK